MPHMLLRTAFTAGPAIVPIRAAALSAASAGATAPSGRPLWAPQPSDARSSAAFRRLLGGEAVQPVDGSQQKGDRVLVAAGDA
jgi:hypothetical protein